MSECIRRMAKTLRFHASRYRSFWSRPFSCLFLSGGKEETHASPGDFGTEISTTERLFMVDIHAHIIPGLDDGAECMEEALKMAAMAVADGIGHMAATSHGNYYPYSLKEYQKGFSALKNELQKNKIPLKVYPGMEIFLDDGAFSLLKKKELLALNHTEYLLVEFPFDESVRAVLQRMEYLRSAGYGIVLAHPERYIFTQKDKELAYYLSEQGCVLQVNAGSIAGDFGEVCRRLSERMLDDGIVSVIATDAHDTAYRPPVVQGVLAKLRRKYPESQLHLWLSENPSRILKGYPVVR